MYMKASLVKDNNWLNLDGDILIYMYCIFSFVEMKASIFLQGQDPISMCR